MTVSKHADEFILQRALCWYWLDGNPDKAGNPRSKVHLAPGVTYWHTPNGGQRSAKEGRDLKQTGTKAGIHDLFFLRPTDFGPAGVWGLLFGLELKEPNGTGRLHGQQPAMHARLLRSGLAASIVLDDLDECKAWLIANHLAIP